jgi:CBS-domain-containing membrane protein
MNPTLIYTIMLALVVGLFVRRAIQAPVQSHKRRAFGIASLAVGLFMALNLLFLTGNNVTPLMLPIQSIAVLLLAVSAFFLFQAWRGGEMNDQVAQIRQLLDNERTRRREEPDSRE